MAAVAASLSLAVPAAKTYEGLRAVSAPSAQVKFAPLKAKGALGARCDYLGSPTNLVMVSSIAAMFVAGRFGLAPAANRVASAGLKLSERPTGQGTGDPAGFTGADVLAFGATGHILGAGIVLALKYLGAI